MKKNPVKFDFDTGVNESQSEEQLLQEQSFLELSEEAGGLFSTEVQGATYRSNDWRVFVVVSLFIWAKTELCMASTNV